MWTSICTAFPLVDMQLFCTEEVAQNLRCSRMYGVQDNRRFAWCALQTLTVLSYLLNIPWRLAHKKTEQTTLFNSWSITLVTDLSSLVTIKCCAHISDLFHCHNWNTSWKNCIPKCSADNNQITALTLASIVALADLLNTLRRPAFLK